FELEGYTAVIPAASAGGAIDISVDIENKPPSGIDAVGTRKAFRVKCVQRLFSVGSVVIHQFENVAALIPALSNSAPERGAIQVARLVHDQPPAWHCSVGAANL